MHYIVFSDLHLGKNFYDYHLNPEFNARFTLNEYWSLLTQKYIFEIIDKQNYLVDEEVTFVFLGDTLDQPNMTFPQLTYIEDIFDRILVNKNWKIVFQLGNHDTSSYKGNWEKTTLSRFCNYDDRLHIINKPEILDFNKFIVFHLPYVRYQDLIPILWQYQKYTRDKNVYLFSHNYIYVSDTFINTPTVSIDIVKDILHCKSLLVFNGHLHVTHYEPQYFQLGSVSPTSFKENPFASGACYYQLGTDNYKLYRNIHIVFFSISNYHSIDKLKSWLSQCRHYNTKVFIQYKSHLQLSIDHISMTYADLVIGLRCRDGQFKTS